MTHDNNTDTSQPTDNISTPGVAENTPPQKPRKHRVLHILSKTLLWIIFIVLAIPVLIYLPPIQDLAIKIAQNVVKKSTGMDIGIGQFRLSFPLDVKLKDVYIVEASGDTMVRAGEAIADVKLMPLLKLDVDLNKLQLNKGYYRMVSPDSSMIMTIDAGFLEVDDKSFVNIKNSEINLNKTKLRDGKLSLFMDVWKKKTQAEDTTTASTPFLIKANDLDIENFNFAMSMLPTIDTMDVAVKRVVIKKAVVDLRENIVKWNNASISDGNFRYLTPTAEYIKTHPAPPAEPSSGPPMRIMGDTISLDKMNALYAVKDAKPLPGFDAQYIQVSDIQIGMRDFYNESSTVKLPLTQLRARERCGLQISSGSGTVGIDSIGLTLDNVKINTLFSNISATADIPFAMMAMDESAPMNANIRGEIGMPDVEAFMPDLKTVTKNIPPRKPLNLNLIAKGSLANVAINKLDVGMQGVLDLKATGFAKNALDYKKLIARVTFDGTLSDPQIADKFVDLGDISLPAFNIAGTAQANGLTYGADFALTSTAGDLAAKGAVAITPENYEADIKTTGLNIANFLPALGIGKVTADIRANGHGFNPLSGTAVTDATINISSIEYNRRNLHNIHIDANLSNAGDLTLLASSPNPGLDFDIEGTGTIHKDDYAFDLEAHLRDVDLQALGLMDSICSGSGDINISGTASPDRWLYDVAIDATRVDWNLPSQYIHLPGGFSAQLKADPLTTALKINSLQTYVDFDAQSGLESLIKVFGDVAQEAQKQIAEQNIEVDKLCGELPNFSLRVNASGRGLLDQFLASSGMRIDTVFARIDKDSLLYGNIGAYNYQSSTLNLDTITLNLQERGSLLDYRAHIGNRPGTMDEFAQVNVNGYVGQNRASVYLTQRNIKNEQGYRIGLTAAMQDSTLTTHITPLKSTIAYMPWTFNGDNFIDINLKNKHIAANLMASSAESSVLLRTQQSAKSDNEELYVKIDNLHIEDFLQMWALAPPIQGDLNADLHVEYEDQRFEGGGTVGLKNFIYEKTRIGDFDLDVDAGYGLHSSTDVKAALRINNQPAIAAYANLLPSAEGLKPDTIGVSLTKFPLQIANPFLGNNVVLGGFLNGDMHMNGSFTDPILNGEISLDSVSARIPMFDATLKFGKDPLKVTDNIIDIKDFDIFAANQNPLSINGTVNARKFSNVILDLSANANNFQLIKSDNRSKGDLFGKVFLNLDATVKGPMSRIDVNGNVNLLGTTDATYRLNMSPSEFKAQSDEDIVKFVNFNDTTQVVDNDSVVESPLNMRINARLTISPGAHIEVLLSNNGTDKVELNPSANLSYYQNYMGDMSLNGTLTLGNGFVRYAVPILGEKMFTFNPNSTITWRGTPMNPVLDVTATDDVKANVTSGSNSRLVNFLVTLNATSDVEHLKLGFDLSTNDDLTIQNELQSMSADQRQTQAMNLLLYGQYMGQNTKANVASGNVLYSMLESQLNSWAAKHVRGVDLTFGVNQYERTTNGVSNTETSYSYQVSKSLLNNRFKIVVGGNYSTDSDDNDIAQNLISDVSFEYVIRQTQTTDMNVRLFRHSGYESILEGEITEMGVGFVYKKRLDNLKSLFHWRRAKKEKDSNKSKNESDSVNKDSVKNAILKDESNVKPVNERDDE